MDTEIDDMIMAELRDQFAVAALSGTIAARGMDVANPDAMAKNAWHFADLMLKYRDWKDEPAEIDLHPDHPPEHDETME